MARARNIKPSIMDNEDLAALEPLTRLLFVYLWMLADREGRLEDRPGRIAHQALGYDRNADADAMLSDLQRAGFIVRYTANGIACIQILQFSKHQAPHIREAASELPAYAPAKDGAEHNLGSAEALPRSPDSGFLIPDCGLRTDNAAASPPAAVKPKAKTSKKTPLPDGFVISDRVSQWAAGKGYGPLDRHLEHFLSYVRRNGKTYVDWDEALMSAIREDWAKLRGGKPVDDDPYGLKKAVNA